MGQPLQGNIRRNVSGSTVDGDSSPFVDANFFLLNILERRDHRGSTKDLRTWTVGVSSPSRHKNVCPQAAGKPAGKKWH